MALIGYARVSTDDQTTDPQTDQLNAARCDRIFAETGSGANQKRPELDALLDYIRPGDVLVVVKLDRLGRTLHHLLDTIRDLDANGIGFRSLSEGIDTTTPSGRLLLHIIGAIAQFERDLIVERTQAGLKAARARGRVGGRRPVMTPEKIAVAREMYESKKHTLDAIAKTIGVSRASVYRSLGEPR